MADPNLLANPAKGRAMLTDKVDKEEAEYMRRTQELLAKKLPRGLQPRVATGRRS